MNSTQSYLRVLTTFARNSLIRDMTFRGNFLMEAVTSIAWALLNLAFYVLIFQYTPMIGAGTGWGKYQFLVFYSTGLLINSLVQTLFMTNADDLSDHIRTGSLDFILLKPMDPQFLVSVRRIDWSSMANFGVGVVLMGYSLARLHYRPGPAQLVLYPVYLACGVAIYYSLMIAMASTAIWIGRNLTLLDFWFYVTTFARYPMEIYSGPIGGPLRWTFTFILPVLIVVNVPARILVQPVQPKRMEDWLLPVFALFVAAACLVVSRWIFKRALEAYRSASS